MHWRWLCWPSVSKQKETEFGNPRRNNFSLNFSLGMCLTSKSLVSTLALFIGYKHPFSVLPEKVGPNLKPSSSKLGACPADILLPYQTPFQNGPFRALCDLPFTRMRYDPQCKGAICVYLVVRFACRIEQTMRIQMIFAYLGCCRKRRKI
jgi:hypothetical protein